MSARETHNPILIILAAARNSLSCSKLSCWNIADISSLTLTLPIVLSIFGICKLKNSQTTELLTCKISPPKSSASTGFNMTRM